MTATAPGTTSSAPSETGDELAHLASEPARAARTAPLPDYLQPARARRARPPRHPRALRAPGRGVGGGASAGGTSSSRPAPPRARRSPSTCPVLDALAREPARARALPLPDEGARAGSGARARRALGVAGLACRRSTTATRRPSARRQIRGWANLVLTNPDMLHIGVLPHHDRWGDVLAQPPLRRRRRGARLPRRLRLARRERAATAAPARADLRRRPAVPARLGDDREPGRARPRAARRATRRWSSDDAAPRAERTIALWNPPLLDAELGLRASALGEASRLLAELVAPRPAHDLLREEPQVGRADPPLRGRAGRRRHRGAARAVPRRLHAGSSGARSSGGSSRASCSASRRPTRSSSGSTSATSTARSRSASRARSRACVSNGAARAGAITGSRCSSRREDALDQYFMREPETLLGRRVEAAILDHANPRVLDGHVARGRVRGAGRRRRRRDARRRGARAGAARARAPADAARGWVWAGQDYPAARVPLRSTTPDAFTVVDAVDRRRARDRRARARVLDRARGRRLPPPRRAVPRARARPRRRGARSSSRSPATGTRRRRRRRRPRSSEPLRVERRLGLELTFGRVSVTEQVVAYQKQGDPRTARRSTRPARPAADDVRRPRRSGSCREPASSRASRRCRACSRHAPRRRALADRAPAAVGDVRPLGHRRPLDEPPPRDRRARPSSSTTATPAGSGSPSAASTSSRAGSPTPSSCSRAARASAAALRASRARSAGT